MNPTITITCSEFDSCGGFFASQRHTVKEAIKEAEFSKQWGIYHGMIMCPDCLRKRSLQKGHLFCNMRSCSEVRTFWFANAADFYQQAIHLGWGLSRDQKSYWQFCPGCSQKLRDILNAR